MEIEETEFLDENKTYFHGDSTTELDTTIKVAVPQDLTRLEKSVTRVTLKR